MALAQERHASLAQEQNEGFIARLNTVWHEKVLLFYGIVMVFHAAEHALQAVQVYVMGWPRPESLGLLGVVWPWLAKSEFLHMGFAIFTTLGLVLLLPGFTGRSRKWWIISLAFQSWHFVEHSLLQGQVLLGQNLFGAGVPTSVFQLWVPRIELHLIYNTLVFVPMILGMYYHMYPPKDEAESGIACTCSRR